MDKAPPVANFSSHIPALDGLRGIAIALVVTHNLANKLKPPFDPLLRIVQTILGAGWIGVTLFFALSGFLITGILLDGRDKPHQLRSFYARRSLRIFPLYYAFLTLYFLILPHFGYAQDRSNEVWFWVYLVNWVLPLGHFNPALGHLWSLCVEEQFYVVWPFVVLSLRSVTLARVCLVLVVVALVARIVCLHLPFYDEEAPYHLTVCRMDALALGAWMALLVRNPELLARLAPLARPAAWIGGFVIVAMTPFTGGWNADRLVTQTAGHAVLAVECALLVLLAALPPQGNGGRVTRWLSSKPLRFLGKYSYAIYIFHPPLHEGLYGLVVEPLNHGSGLHRLAVLVAYELTVSAIVIGAALLSWQLLEKRLLALKRYFP